MTYFLIRVSVFFITYSFAQVVTHTEEFDDGGLKSITYYKKIGNKTTIYKEEKFYEDGSLYLKGNSKNGKRDGIWTTYKPDGTIENEELFKEGVAID